MAEAKSLKDKIAEREGAAVVSKPEKKETRERRVVSSGRDKGVYIKVNTEIYDDFTKINKKRAATNNGMINMLIAEYVRNNKEWLEE